MSHQVNEKTKACEMDDRGKGSSVRISNADAQENESHLLQPVSTCYCV